METRLNEMSISQVQLCSLLINEEEWIEKNYNQHKDWPGLAKWVFVHGADKVYGETNPERVTKDGLSIDKTGEILDSIAQRDPRVMVIHHGWMSHTDRAKCKVEGRNRYIEVAEEVKPSYLIIVDLDEFYTKQDQAKLTVLMDRFRSYQSFTFPRREIWRPPSCIAQPLFSQEVVGGFWAIPCCHWWRWSPGMHYDDCHNTPKNAQGRYLNDKMLPLHMGGARIQEEVPQLIHMGFAARREDRLAKNAYYSARGERRDRLRRWYVDSRSCWEEWEPGDILPRDAQVIPYLGPVPECFREDTECAR